MVARVKKKALPEISVKQEVDEWTSDDIITPDFKRKRSGVRNKRAKRAHIKIEIEPDDDGVEPMKEEISAMKEEAATIKEEPGEGPADVKQEGADAPNIFPLVQAADITGSAPANWHLIYNEIAAMRAKITTPVDTMGCERMPETITPNLRTTNPKLYRFQLLISLMLSSQTKDEVNYDAMVRLQTEFLSKGYEDGLCLPAILNATETDIDQYILKVGFHKRKASFIKRSCQLLVENFDSDIPKTIEQIVTLPGVGPKMGFLLLQKGWNINSGIGVDVHLHRLAQMWGWVRKSDKPEITRTDLEKWLPEKYWADINPLLVGFGQTVCAPRAANCDVCTLAKKGLCRSSDKKLLKAPISEARLEKLRRQRSDLTFLL